MQFRRLQRKKHVAHLASAIVEKMGVSICEMVGVRDRFACSDTHDIGLLPYVMLYSILTTSERPLQHSARTDV